MKNNKSNVREQFKRSTRAKQSVSVWKKILQSLKQYQ